MRKFIFWLFQSASSDHLKKNEEMQEKHLLDLINHTSSMDTQEKRYWKEILPKMPKEHKKRLFKILVTEKEELASLEEKYRKTLWGSRNPNINPNWLEDQERDEGEWKFQREEDSDD